MNGEIFVVTTPGLEEVTGGEVTTLLRAPAAGLHRTPLAVEPGGVRLEAGSAVAPALLLLNTQLRTASRVLVRVARFRARTFQELVRHGRQVPWYAYLPETADPASVRLDVTSRKSRLYHTGAVEERLRGCLAETSPGGRRTAPQRGAPAPGETSLESRFVVRLHRDQVTVSADASGYPLHRRGYRGPAGKAPLRETLAAAMILGAGWDPATALLDPFCGSGTLLIEAAMLAAGVPPGAGRAFAFQRWPVIAHASDVSPMPVAAASSAPAAPILGADRDAGAIAAARENAERAGVADWIRLQVSSLSGASFPEPPGLLITNPPYGRRIGNAQTLRNLYARLGERVRQEWSGGRVVLLSADPKLTGQLRLKTRVLFRTTNGGLPVQAVVADIP